MLSETGFNPTNCSISQSKTPGSAHPNLENVAKIQHFQLAVNNLFAIKHAFVFKICFKKVENFGKRCFSFKYPDIQANFPLHLLQVQSEI